MSNNICFIVQFKYRTDILRYRLGISESMNTSSSTPEYIAEDCQAIQSSASSKVFSPKLDKNDINDEIIKRR